MAKAIMLISTGIDSPVAAWKMKQRGLELVGLHFQLGDSKKREGKGEKEKGKEQIKKICKFLGIKKIYFAEHKRILTDDLIRKCHDQARCVMCKRMMYRVAEKIAEKEGAEFLVTGDNLGQVASQTVENIAVTTQAIKMPILRPLLCNDKQEIIDLAKEIGTYKLSIEVPSTCTAVPKMPLTKARIEKIKKEEEKIDTKSIVREAVESSTTMSL